ncbi:hypothetical protein ACC790_37895, partial [Rhizobium johnstonii]
MTVSASESITPQTEEFAEVSLKTIPFPTGKTSMQMASGLSLEEVEENVRSNGSVLTDGNTQHVALVEITRTHLLRDIAGNAIGI